ncbi:hypothetical protein VCHC62A1_1424B, partial [Vibrio cholerae HC-62A1]
ANRNGLGDCWKPNGS